jgi:predicted component of type VI protein secretion system
MDCHVRIGDLRPILVDRDNFDDILGKLKPTVDLSDRIALLGDFSGSNERAPAACKG